MATWDSIEKGIQDHPQALTLEVAPMMARIPNPECLLDLFSANYVHSLYFPDQVESGWLSVIR